MFTIRRWIEIDAGHRVPYHGSKCRNLHGHRYRITAVVSAPDVVPAESRKSDSGMVMDFGVIKQVLIQEVHDRFDHKLILWANDELMGQQGIASDFSNVLAAADILTGVVRVPCIPTAEELARYWGGLVRQRLWDMQILDANPFRLRALEVQETPTSIAVWEVP